MLWASFTLAFFGFLRSSEYVAPTTSKFTENTLLYEDIVISKNKATVKIKSSKTDPFRQGCLIRLAATNSPLCPVSALHHHMISHPTKRGPLFTYHDKTFLTQKRLNNIIKEAFSSSIRTESVSSHSFRIGAATTAAAAGIPSWLIQQLGRWNSDCFRIYTKIPNETIQHTAAILSSPELNITTTWDPDLAN